MDYTPAWGDLTSVPTGFSDGTDDGFTTEDELTDLLDDNYLSASADAASITSTDIANWDAAAGTKSRRLVVAGDAFHPGSSSFSFEVENTIGSSLNSSWSATSKGMTAII